MNKPILLEFDQPDMALRIDALDEAELDRLDFGVIGFDADTTVRRYNSFESRMVGLTPQWVLVSCPADT